MAMFAHPPTGWAARSTYDPIMGANDWFEVVINGSLLLNLGYNRARQKTKTQWPKDVVGTILLYTVIPARSITM